MEDNAENFRAVFDELDEDGDGNISLDDVIIWLPTEEMKERLKEIWQSSEKNITFRDFKDICSTLMEQQNQEEEQEEHMDDDADSHMALEEGGDDEYDTVRALFDKLDTEGNGFIEMEVLKSLLGDISKNEADKVLENIDTAHPGRVSFEEFYDGFDHIVQHKPTEDAEKKIGGYATETGLTQGSKDSDSFSFFADSSPRNYLGRYATPRSRTTPTHKRTLTEPPKVVNPLDPSVGGPPPMPMLSPGTQRSGVEQEIHPRLSLMDRSVGQRGSLLSIHSENLSVAPTPRNGTVSIMEVGLPGTFKLDIKTMEADPIIRTGITPHGSLARDKLLFHKEVQEMEHQQNLLEAAEAEHAPIASPKVTLKGPLNMNTFSNPITMNMEDETAKQEAVETKEAKEFIRKSVEGDESDEDNEKINMSIFQASLDETEEDNTKSSSSDAKMKSITATEQVKVLKRKYKLLARLGARLEMENESLEERLTQAMSDLYEAKEETSELESRTAELKEKNSRVTEHIRNLRTQNYDLNQEHLQTIETLELEQRRNKRLKEELDESKRMLEDSQGKNAREMRSERIRKLAQSKGLMDAMKAKNKLKEVEKKLREQELKHRAAKQRILNMALQINKKDGIIKSLQDRLHTKNITDFKPLAWDMLSQGEASSAYEGKISERSHTLHESKGGYSGLAKKKKPSYLTMGAKGGRGHKRSMSSSHNTLKPASNTRRYLTAKKILETLKASTAEAQRSSEPTLKLGLSKKDSKLTRKKRQPHTVSMLDLNQLEQFYQNPVKKQQLINKMSTPRRAKKFTFSKPKRPTTPRMPDRVKSSRHKDSGNLKKADAGNINKDAGDPLERRSDSLSWQNCMDFTISAAKDMKEKEEMRDCKVKAELLLEILNGKIGIQAKAPAPMIVKQDSVLRTSLRTPKSLRTTLNLRTASRKKPKGTLKSHSNKPLPRPRTNLSNQMQVHVATLAAYFNEVLKNDELLVKCNLIPIKLEGDDLIQKLSDGLILAKFINIIQKDTIDIRAMNTEHFHDPNYHPFLHSQGMLTAKMKSTDESRENKLLDMQEMLENLTLVFESAKAVGVRIQDARSKHLLYAYRNPAMTLRFLWNLVVARAEAEGSARRNPHLVRVLLKENQGDMRSALSSAAEMGPRDMIFKWILHHAEGAFNSSRFPFSSVSAAKNCGADIPVLEEMRRGSSAAFTWKTIALVLLHIQQNLKAESRAGGLIKKNRMADIKDNDPCSYLKPEEVKWAVEAFRSDTEANSVNVIAKKLREIGSVEAAVLLTESAVARELDSATEDGKKTRDGWKCGFCVLGMLMKDRMGLWSPPRNKKARTDSMRKVRAELMTDDVGDRLERAFRMWINSIGISGLYIQNLFIDCRDGLVLLKVLDKINPGSVPWKKVEMKPNNRFKKVANCNLLLRIGKSQTFRFSLVGIDGSNIEKGNRKFTLALVWQMMRCHIVLFLQTVFDKRFGGRRGGKMSTPRKNLRSMIAGGGDAAIIQWANSTISSALKKQSLPRNPSGVDWRHVSRVKSFKEPHLKKGFYFLLLLWAVDDYVVNWDLVTRGESIEDCILNSRYAISVARKLGATIFLLPEDITELNAKMIMTFVGGILSLAGGA
eukprot:CAMPEP_0114538970 /NCGR_PEP_ID=MMETSP0109-20121206/30437_1 /TAXON_ID=29199 /ORGANISM="Chlorarachnion reptans, Strain CCCM449" /LENGTH=1609 /DNA_ID=CAMNT_0001723045 /DNA_START=34 /DNA_END=4863 /DNA_ORIENTATION=+